jgi:hypothetical protein
MISSFFTTAAERAGILRYLLRLSSCSSNSNNESAGTFVSRTGVCEETLVGIRKTKATIKILMSFILFIYVFYPPGFI